MDIPAIFMFDLLWIKSPMNIDKDVCLQQEINVFGYMLWY